MLFIAIDIIWKDNQMMLLASDSIMLMVFYTKKVQITISYTYMLKDRCVWNRFTTCNVTRQFFIEFIKFTMPFLQLSWLWCVVNLHYDHSMYIIYEENGGKELSAFLREIRLKWQKHLRNNSLHIKNCYWK